MSKPRRKIDWSKYEAGLRQRGSVTFWFSEEAIAQWHPETGGKRGGQAVYSDIAIETSLAIRLVFDQALRQTEGMLTSLISVMELPIKAPDHSTLSRRGGVVSPISVPRSGGPLTIAVDSTGLKIYGAGEWNESKHGGGKRRKWHKLHLAIDESTCDIVANSLTTNDVHDQSEAPNLLEKIDGQISTFLGDGAYDTRGVYDAVADHGYDAASVIVPPRKDAVKSSPPDPAMSQRDQHIDMITKHEQPYWEIHMGYSRRLIAENAIGRFKHIIGPQLRARRFDNQVNEAAIGVKVLNRMSQLGTPRQLVVS
jgi:hypothetical protein